MPSPKTLLPWLLGGTVGLGGVLQGLHWRSEARAAAGSDAAAELRSARTEIASLKREIETLRGLAGGAGAFTVPREPIDRVEKEFGLRFRSDPAVQRVTGEELRDRVAAAIESRPGPSGIDDRQDAWRWIGWLGPDDELLAQLTAVRTVGARGWFDEVTGEAWITDRFDANGIPDQALLLRLLARILIHQNFPPPADYPGDDAARAREAFHQGAAAGCEARFLTANARAVGFMPMKSNNEAALLFSSLPEFVRGITTFPAVEGKGFADALHVRGNETLLAVFRDPPQTTRAILTPNAPPVALPPLELPVTPEAPYLTETAGQLGLRLWLGDAELPNAWRNDRYALFPDGDASSALLWDIELDSKEAADRVESAALKRIASINSTREKRHLRITRPSPLRVRFLNTARADTAARFGGS